MKRVLVTGGTGKLAKAMPHHNDFDIEYIFLSGRSCMSAAAWNIETGRVDANGPFDAVLHLAAATPSGDQNYDATYDLSLAALRLAQHHGIKHIIAASSQAIYGPDTGRPFRETDATNPQNAYGLSKKTLEDTLLTQAGAYGVEYCTILRLGNVVGIDQLGLAALSLKQKNQLKLTQFSDGSYPQRSYADVEMIKWAIHHVLADYTTGVINIAATKPLGLDELLSVFDVQWESTRATKSDIRSLTMKCDIFDRMSSGKFDISKEMLKARVAKSLQHKD